jgi:iduronate 2-sulfatase
MPPAKTFIFNLPRPRVGVAAAVTLFAAGILRAGASPPAERMNVLFFFIDDLRPELHCFGADYIHSPNIDKLAETGVRFERNYCQYAICGPSRASLLTGLRPDTLKIEDIDTYFRRTVPDVVTLPQLFKANGYTAIYLGKVFHPKQEDDAHSWSQSPRSAAFPFLDAEGHVTRVPPGGKMPGEYQLAQSREIVRQRRQAALSKYTLHDSEGLMTGPAIEEADAPDDAYIDGRTAAAAIATLRDLQGRRQPFFLGVGFRKPHLPFVAPKRYFDLYDPATLPLAPFIDAPVDGPGIAVHSSFELRAYAGMPETGVIGPDLSRRLIQAYAACVSFSDAQVGRVLAELDALGLRKNTIIVLWGDNGWHLGDLGMWGKATNFEAATRVPLIVCDPRESAKGAASQALVESVDVYPTLCELAGVPPPAGLQGISFAPLLREPSRPWKQAAFSQFPSPALREWAARPLDKGMRSHFFGRTLEQVEAGLKKEYGARYDEDLFENHVMGYTMRTDRYRFTVWVDRRHPTEAPLSIELYDHSTDPHEHVNVAERPENAELVAKLRAQWLRGWQGARPATP